LIRNNQGTTVGQLNYLLPKERQQVRLTGGILSLFGSFINPKSSFKARKKEKNHFQIERVGWPVEML